MYQHFPLLSNDIFDEIDACLKLQLEVGAGGIEDLHDFVDEEIGELGRVAGGHRQDVSDPSGLQGFLAASTHDVSQIQVL
eukprot:CAMPEP_0170544528 /NCGR_PEP_ID=MMETSP0211-20121228/3249_1 /TAXON_ID=311385 /ORGANISM="Pseudokeronopsis sp., Strain OXSARD2" /LENGTH=79 /DNA_ID=CAMNT_0010848189 /DNA_START=776 /DNA_END=1015 /DNA_ORIENTATION=+